MVFMLTIMQPSNDTHVLLSLQRSHRTECLCYSVDSYIKETYMYLLMLIFVHVSFINHFRSTVNHVTCVISICAEIYASLNW